MNSDIEKQPPTSETISQIIKDLKALAIFYANHYLALSAAFFLFFTAICYIYSSLYFFSFGIDFLLFATLSDVYQPAISGQFPIVIFIYFCLVSGAVLLFKTIQEDNKKYHKNFKRIGKILFFGMVFGSILVLTFFFVETPKAKALQIKDGFSSRYTLHTEGAKIECLSPIASTANYIVVWDEGFAQTHIIPLSSVVKYDLVIEPPPDKFPVPESNSSDLRKRQQQWSEELKTECGFTVVWPEYEHP